MSQFITTMFVSTSPPNHLPPYPTEPKPLLPVFTYAQSQSYVEQELELDARNGTGQTDSVCMETAATWFETLALARPESTYRSPLQRDGDALRPQLASRLSQGNANQAASRPSTPLPGMEDEGAPREFPNYSYKLLPNTKGSPLRSPNPNRSSKDCSGQRQDGKKTSSRDHSVPAQDQTIANKSLLSRFFHSNPRTRAFKPQKSSRGTSSWQLKQYAEATLGSGSLRKAVKLPEGEDRDEWLAVNVVDFYNQINLLYGSITEFCSPQTCPEMKATDEFEYLWQDSENFKRPTKMPAPEYIEHLMAWIQSNIDNEQMFPSRIGVPFPKTFPALLKNMFKRLYRVYAHIYCHHYPVIIELALEPHLNTSFKHYVLFVDEHGLAANSKDYWGPLGDLVDNMLKSE